MTITCKNCSTSFAGKFCPNCSQKADTDRFTIYNLSHDLNHALTHTDKGIFFLMKELCFRPGFVAKEFIDGKRKKYFNPVTYLLLMCTITVVSTQYTGIYDLYADKLEAGMRTMAALNPDKSAVEMTERTMEEARTRMAVGQQNQKIMTLAFVPVLAVLTWVFFRKSKVNYAENLVFNIFLMGHILFLFIIICVLGVIVNPSAVIWLMLLYLPLSWIYTFIAYHQFYAERWRWILLKGIVIQLIYMALIVQASNLYMTLMK